MNHALQVFTYELRRNLRRPGYLIATFLIPVIGFVLLTVATSSAGSSAQTSEAVTEAVSSISETGLRSVGIVDETGLMRVPQIDGVTFVEFADTDAADAALLAGDLDAYYLFPADYLETGSVTQVLARLNLQLISASIARQIVFNSLGQDLDPDVSARLLNTINPEVVNASPTQTASTFDGSFLIVVIFAIALLLSLVMTNGYLMQSVIEEKESRLIEILLSSMRPMQLLAGKIAALGLLGLGQLVVWVGMLYIGIRFTSGAQLDAGSGVISAISGFRFPTEILLPLLLYYLFAYLMFAALYAGIGAISNNMREGPQYAIIFSIPMVIPIWLQSLITLQPDGPFAVFLSIFPLTSPLAMLQRMLVSSVPPWQIILSLGVLLLAAIGAVWFAARLFRVQSLLAGQVPRLRDFPALLRG